MALLVSVSAEVATKIDNSEQAKREVQEYVSGHSHRELDEVVG